MLTNEMSLRRLYESYDVTSIADPAARLLSRSRYSETYPGKVYKFSSLSDNHVSERHTIENVWSTAERKANKLS